VHAGKLKAAGDGKGHDSIFGVLGSEATDDDSQKRT